MKQETVAIILAGLVAERPVHLLSSHQRTEVIRMAITLAEEMEAALCQRMERAASDAGVPPNMKLQ